MLKFDEGMLIHDLPYPIYQNVINELRKEAKWKIVAHHVAEKLKYPRLWISNFENCDLKNEDPSEKLMEELDSKMCTVGILGTILTNCDLLNILAVLSEKEPVKIVTQPDGDGSVKSTACGKEVVLECVATGLPPPSYQWFHNDKVIEGETNHKLIIQMSSISQVGEYKCHVFQIDHKMRLLEEVYSNSVVIDLKPSKIKIIKQPQAYLEMIKGACLKLKCEATGYPEPQFQWYKDNSYLDNQNENLLQVENFSEDNQGRYYCRVYNNVSEKFTESSMVLLDLPREKAVAKVALLIANENYYNHKKLSTPKNDIAKIAQILRNLGFCTICFTDLTFVQMINAMKIFSEFILEGFYGLFYFAGHGFKMQENYMLSIDAPKKFLRKDAICESELLQLALKSDPALFVTVLDMCQTLPPLESNPSIHSELPLVNEYMGSKNLRNLLQAYSTSSYRPSYERMGLNNGIYATHLCKYLGENIPVTKVFELVGKSIDKSSKGSERKQIPMFATTITKPYRLSDSIHQRDKVDEKLLYLEEITKFHDRAIEVNFKKIGIKCRALIGQYKKPFLNCVQVSLLDMDDWEISFYKSISSEHNNLFKGNEKNSCWLLSPRSKEGPLVVSVLQNEKHVGATLLPITECMPKIVKRLDENQVKFDN